MESNLDNCKDSGVVVEFTVRLAFRRDYEWGAFFGERWKNTQVHKDFQQVVESHNNYQMFNESNGHDLTRLKNDVASRYWKIKFPSGYSSEHYPMPDNSYAGDRIIGECSPAKRSSSPRCSFDALDGCPHLAPGRSFGRWCA